MAKFYGEIGYGERVENAEGVWEDVITVRKYYGDVLRNAKKDNPGDAKVNSDFSVSNSIRVMADAYANDHFFAIRYVRWMGKLWTVTEVEVQAPRLILRLGKVYNGQQG